MTRRVPQPSPCCWPLDLLAYLSAREESSHTLFRLIFWPMQLWKPILWFFTSPAKFNSSIDLTFLIPSLQTWVAYLDSSRMLSLPMHIPPCASVRSEGCYSATLLSCLACLISYIDLILLIQHPAVDSNHKICFVNLGGDNDHRASQGLRHNFYGLHHVCSTLSLWMEIHIDDV